MHSGSNGERRQALTRGYANLLRSRGARVTVTPTLADITAIARVNGRDVEDWIRWSPATYARQATNIPPHLLMHSGSNGERRRALTRGYANLLRSRGARVTVFDGGRYNHGTIARYLGRPGDAASAAVANFLSTVIGR
jgi:hypothetical protein